MECFCFLRNVQDLLADGKTPYERRFGEPFKVPGIPFGAMVEYLPNSVETKREFISSGRKYFYLICFDRERTLERRHSDC